MSKWSSFLKGKTMSCAFLWFCEGMTTIHDTSAFLANVSVECGNRKSMHRSSKKPTAIHVQSCPEPRNSIMLSLFLCQRKNSSFRVNFHGQWRFSVLKSELWRQRERNPLPYYLPCVFHRFCHFQAVLRSHRRCNWNGNCPDWSSVSVFLLGQGQ